jgi:hypothetical protein
LHFAEEQLFWECCTKYASESIPTELPLSISRTLKGSFFGAPGCSNEQSRRLELQAQWPGIVAACSKSALTFDKDKLVAVAGIASKMIEMWGGSPTDYLAGLWRDRIAHEMLWRVDGYRWNKKTRPAYKRASSWSWAAIDTEIMIPSLYTERLKLETCHCLLRISEIEVNPLNNISASNDKRTHSSARIYM